MTVTINGNGAISGLSITTTDLADSSVTTAKIAASAVATVDIADSAVTTAKIADSNVTTAKIADANVTGAKIAANAVTVAKMAREGSSGQVLTSNGAGSDPSYQTISTTPTTAQVLSATAGAAVGEVGTYAFFSVPSGNTGTFTQGSTYAASGLRYAGGLALGNAGRSFVSGTAPAGTWRAMGIGGYRQGCCVTAYGATLFLRIS